MSTTRTDHKDRLFQRLFGDPANKGSMLSLYNALNHTSYTDERELEINTIEDVIYMGMKNDASCILDGYMTLTEHQSTFNPNMPLRGLMYFGRLYDKYMKQQGLNLYSRTLLKIPTPKYFVLYNGDDDKPDRIELKLSDAFIREVEEGTFEWTATMLNINYGHNTELLDACRTLKEYSLFVDRVKTNRASGMSVEYAVTKAVDDCIADNILRSYLTAHKAEVIGMCITEYNEAETMQAFRREGWLEGRKEGRKEMIGNMLSSGKTPGEIASFTGIPIEEIRAVEESMCANA